MESYFSAQDGARLFYQAWRKPESRFEMIISHGQGEHSECYHRLVKAFSDKPVSIWGWDLRGHGKSDGRRGFVRDFSEYTNDYQKLLELVLPQIKAPVVLVAHSMGALIQIRTLLDQPKLFEGIHAQCLSGPLFGLALPVPEWKRQGAGLLNSFLPQVTLYNEIRNEDLSGDPEVLQEFSRDPLRHYRISSGAYLGMVEAMTEVKARAQEVQLPTLIQCADPDPIISTQEAQNVFEHLGAQKKKMIRYPNAKHEIFNDTIRAQVFADLQAFLESVLNPKSM